MATPLRARDPGGMPSQSKTKPDTNGFTERPQLLDGLVHVFFPKRTPQVCQDDLENIEDELLAFLADHVEGVLELVDTTQKWKSATGMKKWAGLQRQTRKNSGLFVSSFLAELKALQYNEKLPFYIRKQNCTIIFTKVENGLFRIETFRPCLPPDIIMSSVESLSVQFPHTVDVITNVKLLHSPCFANQILDLTNNEYSIAMPTSRKGGQEFVESRDPAEPILVSDLLVGMLDPAESNNTKSVQVTKKIRDNVNWKQSYQPFRRSGLWLSAKITLHLILNEDLAEEDAKLIYKITLLQMMSELCEWHSKIDWDFTYQMLAKIGKRTKKLYELETDHKSTNLVKFKEDSLKRIYAVIDKVHAKLMQNWNHVPLLIEKDISLIDRSKEEFEGDILHDIPLLNKYLQSAREPINQMLHGGTAGIIPVTRKTSIQDLIRGPASTTNTDVNLDDVSIWLYDVEAYVSNLASFDNASACNILELMKLYAEKATRHIKRIHDPVAFSRMVQTLLLCFKKLDEIATCKFPLLKEYKTGIDTEIFKDLLILGHEEELSLNQIETFFKTRNENARHSCIIENSAITYESFSARFAETNEEMIKLRNKINLDIQEAIARKYKEIAVAKESCVNLQTALKALASCDNIESKKFNMYTGLYDEVQVHDPCCRRCRINDNLFRERKSVKIYEKLLPDANYLQNAIVFEILIPEEIACHRDALILIRKEILQLPILHGTDYMATQWVHSNTSYEGLRPYKPYYFNNQQSVVLGSRCKPTTASHYVTTRKKQKTRNLDIFEYHEKSFIVPNGMTCVLYNVQILKDYNKPNDPFSFQIETSTPYANLQFSVSGTSHTHNEVLAKQRYSCHSDITTAEFSSFGSLRSGHRIQHRNLYKFLSDRTLNLEAEPVLAIILQTIWQCGPLEEVALNTLRQVRSSSLEFYNSEFSQEFLNLLKSLIDLHAKNWSSPLPLIAVVVIINKILECSSDSTPMITKCTSLLKRIREIVQDWIKTIEDLLSSSENSEGEKSFLKMKLLQSLICSALSHFSTNAASQHTNDSHNDVNNWLTIVSRMNYYVNVEKVHEKFSPFMKLLLQMGRQRIALTIENYMHHKITAKVLDTFANSVWTYTYSPVKHKTWGRCLSNKGHVYEGKFTYQDGKAHVLHVDILFGKVLVDGYPPSSLPYLMTQNSLYCSYFHSFNFKVQRDNSTFTTANKVNGKMYTFFMTRNNALICREIEAIGTQYLELLNPNIFQETVAPTLLKDYTHWLDCSSKTIYFRKKFNNNSTQQVDYTLAEVNGKWVLHDENQKKHVLSIQSDGHKLISNILNRIEESQHIYTFLNNGTVSAKLPRMGLNFVLKNTLLYSLEYQDSYISLNQEHKGCFVGLKDCLLLERKTNAETGGKKQLILVHYGKIETKFEYKKDFHQRTVINKETIRQPPFFAFEMDQDLKRLKADKSKAAWLYLAALHAATSSCLPDKFTGQTGTEMAMYILQSALVWSCSQYDNESMDSLQFIQNLAPKREYYPRHLEKQEMITWPALPCYAAFDGYDYVVSKLIKDSERLADVLPGQSQGYSKTDQGPVSKTHEKLRLRSYLRNIHMYNPGAHLSEEPSLFNYNSTQPAVLTVRKQQASSILHEVAMIRNTADKNCYMSSPNLLNLLITPQSLPGKTDFRNLTEMNLLEGMQLEMRKDWLRLYSLAHSVKKIGLEDEFTMLLCVMAYKGVQKEQLLNLHYISKFSANFPDPSKAYSDKEYNPADHIFDVNKIQNILKEAALDFSESPENYGGWYSPEYRRAEAEHEERVRSGIETYAKSLISSGHKESSIITELAKSYLAVSSVFENSNRVATKIVQQFTEWKRNLGLKTFVMNVETILKSIYAGIHNQTLTVSVPNILISINKTRENPLKIDLSSYYDLDILQFDENVNMIYTNGKLPDAVKNDKVAYMNLLMERLSKCLMSNNLTRKLLLCGLYPRLVPSLLFRKLLDDKKNKTLRHQIIDTIGAIAVILTYIRQTNRCIKYANQGDQMALELKREQENKGHANWSPKERPEWLLLELDLDLMIRPIQVQVAEHMMNMPDGRNGAMQLNMGEGKTSLIVPMLVAVMANAPDALCRVTVLPSIFKTNLNILSFAIGGLLNRRVYVIPCRRDVKIDQYLPKFWDVYKECQKMKGVVLTLPEYRLSQRLLMYEKLQSNHENKISVGLNLLELENWLRKHCRDVLDESDELLNPKYQFIYTLGEQISLGGGSLRWVICQKILSLVPKMFDKLSSSYGEAVIEFDSKAFKKFPEQFIPSRLLNDKCQHAFYNLLADAILEGESDLIGSILSKEDRRLVKQFLVEEEITKDVHEEVQRIFADDDNRLDTILLLSGYIRRGILKLTLRKRWRVEFGVDPLGRRNMAVPFRAKDVAADRTEFGHPDVAIVLTHLSYYYSGLTDNQLDDCFHLLKTMLGPESIYDEWISQIPNERVHHSIKSYIGVNLRDFVQRTKYLFPVLRKHKQVIDFWLTHKVFPKESKQFPGKIITTAWDLCYERNKHPTVGFSGTNDSIILLPKPITQQDLPELQMTNKEMEEILKRPENSHNRHLRMGVSCKEILELMKKDALKVLIDAGALMLELKNEQIAHLWLEVDDQIDAVVYFTEKSELYVKVRTSAGSISTVSKRKKLGITDTALELSPYRERLQKCAVFLDDQHTRGTDLKFPNGFKACVTVGSGMRRDKLIQASMRMRKLGAGHSVSFYLSNDVYNKINIQNFSTTDILNWVCSNSKEFEKEGLVHWSLAGKNYAQKLAAEDIFHYPNAYSPPNCTGPVKELTGYGERARILGDQCKDEEIVKLRDMYGSHLKNQLIIDLTSLTFTRCLTTLEKKNGNHSLPRRIQQDFVTTRLAVLQRLMEVIPDKRHLACNLDEEQEKELEPEHEEVRHVERPRPATPQNHSLHNNVLNFCNGIIPANVGLNYGILHLLNIFKDTTFWNKVQPNNWHSEIFISEDFVRVIHKTYSNNMDDYLRQITYIASLTTSEKCYLLLLSPFEANELMAHFRQKITHPNVKLHLFSPRYLQGQDILINNPGLQLPPLNPTVIKEDLLAPLFLASGTLFFKTMREQQAYASFLGFIPRPWTQVPVLENALEKGWITKTGFLLPKSRHLVRNIVEQTDSSVDVIDQVQSVFNSDPTSLVNSILENKHPALRESAHVKQLLSKCAFVEIEEGVTTIEDRICNLII